MNRKPYIIPSKTNNKNMERYLQKKLSEVGEGGDGSGGKSPYVGENGHWFEWDIQQKKFVDTGVSAQGPEGKQGPQGIQGNTGSSVNYPFELVNNLTTNDATKGLSAAQGYVLDGKVSQLEAEVNYNEVNTHYNYIPGLYAGYSPKKLLRDTLHGLSELIIVNKGDDIVWSCGTTDTFTMCLFCYDEFGNKVDDWTNNLSTGVRVISDIMSAGTQNRYILRASFLLANASNAYVEVNGVRVWEPGLLFDAEKEFNSLKERMMQFRFDGSGTTYVSQKVFNLVPGNRYRLYPKSSTWNHSSAPSVLFILGVAAYAGSSKTDLVAVRQGEIVADYYDFVAVENDYVEVGVRADVGETVYLDIVDITYAHSEISSMDARISTNSGNIASLEERTDTQVVKLTGNGSGFVSKTITLQKGRYIVFFGGTWGKTAIGSAGAMFEIEVGGKYVVRCNVANASDLQDCYFVEFDEEVSAIVGVRADFGNKVSIYFQNLTSVSQYLSHNNFQTSFDKAEGREFLFLGKSFVQADTATNGGTGTVNNYRVSQASLLEIPYPKAKLHFKLPNHIFAKMTFGDYSYQLNNEISWVSNGQTLEVPEKVLYYRLTFARSTTLVASIGGTVAGSSALSVDEVLSYVNSGEIAISFDNISVFSVNALQEQYLKVCMRKYTQSYSSDRDKGFNYFPTILHLTDTHGDATRIRRALQYAKMLNVETVVLTGDIVCGDTRNEATYLKDIEDENGIDIYPCIGNHDTYGTAVYDNGGGIGVNPAYRQWNTITKNVLTKPNVVSPTGITYPTYYHFDDTTRKLRFIALNLYEKGRDYTYSGAIYVSLAQINWLISVLASTPQDYGVFIMMHQAEGGITKDAQYEKFYGVEWYNPQSKLTGDPIRKIVDAFMGKTTVSDSYTQYINGIDGEQETNSYSADFSNVASGVEFIAYLTGHEHFDKIGYVAGATHKQLMLNITCTEAGYGNNYVSAANISELPRDNGSTQDAITIYVIDRDDKTIRLARLGSIITSKFEQRDYMVIPYSSVVRP